MMENEKRLIDANELEEKFRITKIIEVFPEWEDLSFQTKHKLVQYGKTIKMFVQDAPTVYAVEVVHGRWKQVQRWATKAKYRCSVCGREIMSATKVNIEKYPYCHCGAKMDGDCNA